jgi:hypothetical protein
MKRIARLPDTPAGLTRFHADPAVGKTWDDFGNFELGAAKRELTAELVARQQCGVRI